VQCQTLKVEIFLTWASENQPNIASNTENFVTQYLLIHHINSSALSSTKLHTSANGNFRFGVLGNRLKTVKNRKNSKPRNLCHFSPKPGFQVLETSEIRGISFCFTLADFPERRLDCSNRNFWHVGSFAEMPLRFPGRPERLTFRTAARSGNAHLLVFLARSL